MSVTHTRFGALAVKSRASRLGAIGSACFESVVRVNRRFRSAYRPLCRIRRSTRRLLVRSPRPASSARTRGLPYVLRLPWKAVPMCADRTLS